MPYLRSYSKSASVNRINSALRSRSRINSSYDIARGSDSRRMRCNNSSRFMSFAESPDFDVAFFTTRDRNSPRCRSFDHSSLIGKLRVLLADCTSFVDGLIVPCQGVIEPARSVMVDLLEEAVPSSVKGPKVAASRPAPTAIFGTAVVLPVMIPPSSSRDQHGIPGQSIGRHPSVRPSISLHQTDWTQS